MPTLSTLIAFTLLNMSMALIPGPDVLCIVSNALARGRRAGIDVCLGMASACLLHVLFASLGLTALLLATPTLYLGLKLAGASYLAWIAWGLLRRPAVLSAAGEIRARHAPFLQGAFSSLFNPKIAMFFLAILPQFIDPTRGSAAGQSLLLGVICVSSGTAVNLVTACTAARLSVRLQSTSVVQQRMQRISGAVLMAVALHLVLAQASR
jgi:threonine/homoserine/homoserine lactone efflux protein